MEYKQTVNTLELSWEHHYPVDSGQTPKSFSGMLLTSLTPHLVSLPLDSTNGNSH